MSTVYDENSLSTALDFIENIESRYGRLADRLDDVHKFASYDHPNGFIGQ
ncbi:RNA-binding protein [Acidithiobacillus thiooxidans]|nr:hypothetical protein [Acidithiobacillus thiooxidans]MBU2842830.1 hypothetical protein [Acidithiobacillus thiooxidans]